jgi:hypothetical protein
MMTTSQRRVLEYLVEHPEALPTEITAALYPQDADGDVIVSISLTALEKKGLIGADNRVMAPSTARREHGGPECTEIRRNDGA